MIVKNEEDVIARCLDSVADIIDEIIIVDTGSIDKTKKIVKNYTSKIYDFEWIDDFSAARNYSFSKATNDYILWLDADDVILEEDRVKLKELKNTLNSGIDVVMMKYNVGFDIDGKVNFSYYRERLVKRNNNPQWHDPVHEHLDIRGTIINTNICITHDKIHAAVPGRNLKIYEKMLAEGKELSPRSLYYYSRELYYNANYDEAIAYYNKFLDSGKGWFEDCITACYDLSICYNHKGDQGNRLKTLLRSFAYDTPRAEICCGLGYYYIEKQDYNRAIFWFDLATKLEKPEENWGFSIHDCWDYLPNIQLCICYDKLGYIEKAIKHNDRAGEIKPGDPFFLYNKTYFDSLQENNK
ncbi:MAG: glycosyltransferase [Bacillota bacterium]|nr:glycosyltransferase [Bacillota bacterium]